MLSTQFFALKEATELDHEDTDCGNLLLRNELEILSSLKHPGVLKVIDNDFECSKRRQKSMLLEYCSAGSLFDLIQRTKTAG